MKIKCVVQDDDSIVFYKNDEVFIYMTRKTKWGGRVYGEIYYANDKLLLKVKSFLWLGIKITYQNLGLSISNVSFYLYDRFALGKKDKLEILNFLIYRRLYWNNKFIADVKLVDLLKYNTHLEINFNTKDELKIYYSTILFCTTILYADLY